MKKDTHPDYQIATVKCVCGHEFKTRSTLKEIKVEICSECHPFFTGQQKLVDSAGRVDRFFKKYGRDYAAGVGGGSSGAAEEKTERKAEAPKAEESEPAEAEPAAGEPEAAADAEK